MEWKTEQLGNLITIKYGKDHKKLKDGPFPVYGSGGIMRFVDTAIYNKPSLLLPRKGSLNNIMFTDKPFWTVDTMFWSIIDESKIEPKFLYYAMCKKNLVALNVGTSVPSLTVPVLEDVSIPYPPIPIQRKIAGILSALDSKIENNNKINANLEAQAQALFKSWFVDFTPFKDQPFVDSELGPIPQGWKVGTLGDIANIIMGQSPAGSSYNERGNGVIFYQGRTEFGFRFPNVRLYTTMPKRYAEPMSILLSVRAPVGDINVAIEKCCIGRGLASISSKRGLHSFLLYLVKSLKNRLEVFNGEGTVFGSINKNTLTQFKIIIPPIEMQEKFNEIIQRHDCMVLELHKEIINLSTQRDTLLPKLMSGEIKL